MDNEDLRKLKEFHSGLEFEIMDIRDRITRLEVECEVLDRKRIQFDLIIRSIEQPSQ